MGRERKTVIAGTGRCGTTCLIQILTRAGLDTGLHEVSAGVWRTPVPRGWIKLDPQTGRVVSMQREKADKRNTFVKQANAGCEILLAPSDDPEFVRTNIPEVIKDPRLAWCGHELIDQGILQIRHLILCVRNLKDVATSKKERAKHDTGSWYQHSFDKIYDDSAWQLGVCISEMVTRDIPLSFLSFPRFVQDEDYFLTTIQNVFPNHAPDLFRYAWQATANRTLVHHNRGSDKIGEGP